MIFNGYFRSSAAWRCRIAFNIKGVSPQSRYVHLRKGEQRDADYLSTNPQGLVPSLVLDDGRVLTQSLAIIEWLDETEPQPPLLPADPVLRAQARAFAQVIACDIHPLQNLRVLQYLRSELGQDQAGLDAWCGRWLGDGLAACERIAGAHAGEGEFCFGDRPGIADICLVPQLASADRFGVGLDAMPRLRAIREACEALDAFRAAAASRQPDADA
jgi:maleylacetoacetate isomerase